MKKLPIGIDDFKRVIEEDYYYVDKTELISSILETGSLVYLLPRPRRFGKTINLMMLRYFFEKTNEDNSNLFFDLNIWKEEKYRQYQGKYPVIYFTLKDVKYITWEETYNSIKDAISSEYNRHKYLKEGNLLEENEKEIYNKIIRKEAGKSEYADSLKKLSEYLTRYHKEKAIILVDEYDVVIQSGHANEFYEQAIEFMRNWLSGGLKNNLNLQFGVLTGILRISKESIFSGLNNLSVYSMLDKKYSEYFGFTEKEVEEILKYYRMQENMETVKKWYDGYIFGETEVYNPWSILNYIERKPKDGMLYWANTSRNDLIESILTKGDESIKKDLEKLIKGESIEKIIDDNIEYRDVGKSDKVLWSFLLMSGYLKVTEMRIEKGKMICKLQIPNLEVEMIYEKMMEKWFTVNDEKQSESNYLLNAIITGDESLANKMLNEILISSTSYFDTSEKFYHGLVLGLLVKTSNEYELKSNQESGYGRYDIMLIPKDKEKNGIIIEFKKIDEEKESTLEEVCENALKQIEQKQYEQVLKENGIEKVLKYGIAFETKKCKVKKG